jgi:hypothetical protein
MGKAIKVLLMTVIVVGRTMNRNSESTVSDTTMLTKELWTAPKKLKPKHCPR